ncbi:diguanylate cyclase domain-containing protein [Vogesella oryzae]|uniref:diguanylate cyclase domain-containing protein n=1 Tax=Vogesella oryzae TaxID=1735285 RepID=UPI001582FEB0|nr:diguanylate cyclase [Vogesella oryzae]
MLQTLWPGSLQARLALFCALAILLVSLLLCGTAYQQDRARLREQQLHYTEEIVSRLADDIDERVRSRQVLLEQAAASLQPSIDDIRLNGAVILRQFHYLKGSFGSVVLYDADGRIVADYPALPGRVGLQLGDRAYFRQTREQLRGSVSEPVRTRGLLHRDVVVFSAPILDGHGQFAGMLGGSLELSAPEFFGELRSMAIGNSGYITLTSRKSRLVLLDPDRSRLLKPVTGGNAATLARALSGWNGSELPTGSGDGALRVYRNLHNADWLLTGVYPQQEAFAPLAELDNDYLLLLLLALLSAIPLAWWGTRRLLRPLAALQRKVRALPDGRGEAILVEGCYELQALAETVARIFRERQQIADTLATREAMFSALNDTSPLGVFVCDADGVLSYGNKAALALAGMERGSAYWFGRSWLEAVHSSCYQPLAAAWAQWSRAPVGEFRQQIRLNHVQHQPLLVTLRCSRMAGAGPVRFLAVLEDISENEENRSALQGERQRLQALLQSVGDAVILANQHDEVLQMNASASELLGVKLEQAHGRNVGLFVSLSLPERDQPVTLAQLADKYHGQTVALNLLGRDMRQLPVLCCLSVVESAGSMQGYRVCVLRDDSARRRSESQRVESERDGLTGTFNRRGMLALLGALIADDNARQQPHCVAQLDLDHFRQFNDKGGPQAGDRLLQEVARILLRRLRTSDCVARLDGDRFGLLLYRCSSDTAERILNDIRHEVSQLRPDGVDSRQPLTASVGLTTLQAGDRLAQEVLQRAERRCQRAKHLGRDQLASSDL